jgi:hypothetical protein
MRSTWVKRVLFLLDRAALVNQAVNAFKAHLTEPHRLSRRPAGLSQTGAVSQSALWSLRLLSSRPRKTAGGAPRTLPSSYGADLPGFFVPMISRKMAPDPRGAHEEEPIH